jgi:hypothetical protein
MKLASTLDKAIALANFGDGARVNILKQMIKSRDSYEFNVNAGGQPLDFRLYDGGLSKNRPQDINRIYIDVPIPFKEGDILEDVSVCGGVRHTCIFLNDTKPCNNRVELPNGESVLWFDQSDISANVIYIHHTMYLTHYHPSLTDLRYARGEVPEFLRELAKFYAEESTVEELLNAHMKYLAELKIPHLKGERNGQ